MENIRKLYHLNSVINQAKIVKAHIEASALRINDELERIKIYTETLLEVTKDLDEIKEEVEDKIL